ncbi:MAG: DNA translocase FtsK [Bacteroidota bacterium]
MAKGTKENKVLFGDVKDFTEPEVEAPKEAPKKGAKGSFKPFKFLADERFIKSLGIGLLLFAVFLAIAGFSFLLTWQADQSLVKDMSFGLFQLDNELSAQNALGKLGAWLGFVFFYKGFGVASFAFCLIFMAVGIFLLTKLQPIPIFKTLRYSFFTVIFISLFLGFVFNHSYQILGGVFGHFGAQYLQGILGNIGTSLFLLSYVLVFTVAIFNIEFYKPGFKIGKEQFFESSVGGGSEVKDAANTGSNVVEGELAAAEEEALPPLDADDFVLVEKPIENTAEITEEEAEFPEDTQNPQITFADGLPLEELDTEEDALDELPITELAEEIAATVPIELPLTRDTNHAPDAAVFKTDSGLVLEVNDALANEEEEPAEPARKAHYGIDEAYDPTLEYSNYKFPTIELLTDYGDSKSKMDTNELNEKTRMIEETLRNYNIGIKKISATVGPTVTLYEIIPQDGVRIAKIKNLEDDIALSLAALGIRIIAPIPGKGTIGIEVPNSNPAMVPMRSLISSSKFINSDMDLPIAFGKTISNEVFVADLAKMPHLLMAGATGQGKSVGLNAILVSLLYKKHPSQIKFVLVDPKKVELNIYKLIERHFLAKIPGDAEAIITDTKLVVTTLSSLCKEMDDRYDLLKDAQVRNLKEYNAKFLSRRLVPTDKMQHRFLPYIVVVIDELADLMMTAGKEVELPIARLAQLARAIGIHLILATQRPSVNIITGTIKANFPARVAFRVSQKIDSRTILDANGADQLIGKGDMLFSNGNDLVRLQCAFVDTPEVERIVEFIGNQNGNEPYLLPLVQVEGDDGINSGEGFNSRDKDELFDEAAHLIVSSQQGSTSLLQRKLNLGYNRAGRLIDQLEKAGIVGPFKGSKAREVLVSDIIELEDRLKNL